jgi:hypothetical protein
VVLKPILTEDSLQDFQRRVDALKSLEICVPADSIGQIQKYDPGLASSLAASREFFNCNKLVFRPDFDLTSQSQVNSGLAFVKASLPSGGATRSDARTLKRSRSAQRIRMPGARCKYSIC